MLCNSSCRGVMKFYHEDSASEFPTKSKNAIEKLYQGYHLMFTNT